MSDSLKTQLATSITLVIVCLALTNNSCSALFLGNLIGCNSFGCRLAALESDVSLLKQQVARLSGGSSGNTVNPNSINNFRPSAQDPYNQGMMGPLNQGQLGQFGGSNGQLQSQLPQPQQESQNNSPRVNYANLTPDYQQPQQQQQLRRVPGFSSGLNNQLQ